MQLSLYTQLFHSFITSLQQNIMHEQSYSSSSSSSSYSINSSSIGKKVLVGVSLNEKANMELLSWAVEVAAKTNDTVVALHVLVEKEESCDVNRYRCAKAFVISVLGELVQICQTKQVKLEAKVKCSSSIEKGLADEAAVSNADYLLIGGSRNQSQKFLEILKYCFEHCPETCSVAAIRAQNSPDQNTSVLNKHTTYECNSSFGSLYEDNDEELSSPIMKRKSDRRSQSGIWRRLSFVKLLSPLFRSSLSDDIEDDSGIIRCSKNFDDQKPTWKCFTYDEISHATDNFSQENIVGRGGYAEVFKGRLPDGQKVAVKRLSKGNKTETKEKEFLTELGIVGHVFHPNTSYLKGCCIENGLHLVFDFSPNGTLASALHGVSSKPLEWKARYKIAKGVARGLHYLHKRCKRRIIHRDIKASNVLLGPDFEPQISDFGLAKWLPRQWTHHYVNPIEGTFGYLAPEYFMHGVVDEKTDVFAYGVLLLEIISGRRPIDSTKSSLLLWAKPFIESNSLVELVDPKLEGSFDMEQLERLAMVASNCICQTSTWRPSMSEVLEQLISVDDSEIMENLKESDLNSVELDDYIVI